ncbi:endonuclease/exonuclease/phosphatase family protein [Anatilimnocola floriformis]|uniref:endonuclease/exonuclease/phosphatase family protein n=1 Tax=Anatilimnocola floriformis TaxID=2948575 RepID=UPI0020C3A3AE|nr:endonuclease/exonuclease/phosphatase family protein [Anatilimnocola floriformis]
MKTSLNSVLWLICIFAGLCTARAEEPLRLRVLSYNIHHAEGVDRKLDVPRIAEVMLSVKPDVIAVQEVDRKVKRSRGEDQPAELARLTKMHAAFGENIELQGGHYGNLLLSRFPIIRHKNHLLPNIDKSEQRGVIAAELQIAEGKPPLLFYATHFDFRSDERERLASVKMINELAAAHADQPALLAGDLNATPESKTLLDLAAAWTQANDKPLPTIPVEKPSKQIDFILYRPSERWKVIEVRVLNEAIASDHRAIFAELEMLPAQ